MKSMEHKINLSMIAEGFGISEKSLKEFLNDGRVMGRLGEFIRAENRGSKRSKSESSPYDIDDKENGREEVRAISKSISFASSKEVGIGRKVTKEGFKNKMNSVDIFIGVDYRDLSKIKLIEITKEMIYEMEKKLILTKNKSVNAKKLFNFIDNNGK
jgi:hypothetical protein